MVQAMEPEELGVDGKVGSKPVPEAVRFECLLGVIEQPDAASEIAPAERPKSSSKAVGPLPRALMQACCTDGPSERLAEGGRTWVSGTSWTAWSVGNCATVPWTLSLNVLARPGRRTPGRVHAGCTGVRGVCRAAGVEADVGTDVTQSMLVGRDPGRSVRLDAGAVGV